MGMGREKWLATALLAAVLASQNAAPAEVPGTRPSMPTQQCWFDAAQRNGVDVVLLYAVPQVESAFRSNAIHVNGAGLGYDLGMMQINSVHFPMLARHGITPESLLDPCVSVQVGAWILGNNIRRMGYGWQAIASYNTGSVNARNASVAAAYYARVSKAHAELSARIAAESARR